MDLKSLLELLKHIFRLLTSRGSSCIHHVLAFFRRLFSPRVRLGELNRARYPDPALSTKRPCTPLPCPGSALQMNARPSGTCIMASTAAAVSSPGPTPSPNPSIPGSQIHQYPPHVPVTVKLPSPIGPNRALSPATSNTNRTKRHLQPFAPEEVNRYERQARINRRARTVEIQRFKLDYNPPSGHEWQRCTHPEGSLYFCLERDGRRTVTDSNIDDQRIRDIANAFVLKLWPKVALDKYPQAELVIDISYNHDTETCKYYFVSHDALVVFWLREYIPDLIFSRIKGVEAIDHIRLAIEAQYWFHCELFPNHILIAKPVVDGLRSILLHATSDAILSDGSLVPFSVTELQQLLDLVASIADTERFDQHDGCIMSVIGRLMRIFTRLKFVNFHGQAGARLNADQSLYSKPGEQWPRLPSHIVRLLDLILFNAPSAHVTQLYGIWVDHTINVLRWRSFIGTLSNEWNGFTIYSTVLLAVDISFLAIPEMDGDSTIQTAAQFAIYLSTLSAVGSLVASVLLTNQSRGQGMQSADQAASYMLDMAKTSVGLETLGIMYSLPFGLIMWGMIFFILALSIIVFGQGTLTPRLLAIPFCVIIAILASWPAWYRGEEMFFWLHRRKSRASPLP